MYSFCKDPLCTSSATAGYAVGALESVLITVCLSQGVCNNPNLCSKFLDFSGFIKKVYMISTMHVADPSAFHCICCIRYVIIITNL